MGGAEATTGAWPKTTQVGQRQDSNPAGPTLEPEQPAQPDKVACSPQGSAPLPSLSAPLRSLKSTRRCTQPAAPSRRPPLTGPIPLPPAPSVLPPPPILPCPPGSAARAAPGVPPPGLFLQRPPSWPPNSKPVTWLGFLPARASPLSPPAWVLWTLPLESQPPGQPPPQAGPPGTFLLLVSCHARHSGLIHNNLTRRNKTQEKREAPASVLLRSSEPLPAFSSRTVQTLNKNKNS